jgi:hypothetical protein
MSPQLSEKLPMLPFTEKKLIKRSQWHLLPIGHQSRTPFPRFATRTKPVFQFDQSTPSADPQTHCPLIGSTLWLQLAANRIPAPSNRFQTTALA